MNDPSALKTSEPCADPLCFTWFGHELGHTKDYLIDTILYERGVALVRNPGERVGPIPRYGRSLPVRTLFQIPYVHLYEWAVLMALGKLEVALYLLRRC